MTQIEYIGLYSLWVFMGLKGGTVCYIVLPHEPGK